MKPLTDSEHQLANSTELAREINRERLAAFQRNALSLQRRRSRNALLVLVLSSCVAVLVISTRQYLTYR